MTLSKKKTVGEPKLIVVVTAFAAFLATFNETYLNVAFTPIMQDMGVGVATVQWLAAAYMLGAAVMVPVSAFAYRSLPTRPLFLSTVGLLILGSVIGALAPVFPVLLAGRIVQALGTGMLIPIGMNITLEVAPREKLGTYMGIMGAMTTLGPSLSILVAGTLLSFVQWQVLLWVFAALSLVCFLCGAALLSNIAKLTRPHLDAASVALIGIALIGILYGVSTIFSGNTAPAMAAAAVGVLCLILFILRQKKLREPLIDLRPLAVKPFAAGIVINMLSLIVIFAMNIIMPIFMQSAMGASSFQASVTLFPAIVLCCVIAPIAGKIYDKHGARLLLPVGFALIAVFAAVIGVCCGRGSLAVLAILYIPVICGSALIIGPVQSYALSHLQPQLNPHGVTVMSTGFQIAGCVGSSVFTGVYSATQAAKMISGVSEHASAENAFMTTALLAAACALAGLVMSLRIGAYSRAAAMGSDNAGSRSIHVASSETGAAMEAMGVETSPLRSIMKTDVYTVFAEDTLLNALRLITDKKISGVPVLNSAQQLCGFISDGDILRYLGKADPLFDSAYSLAAINSAEQGFDRKLEDLTRMQVKDIAIKKVITVDVNEDLGDVCKTLTEFHLKKAPVLENGCLIGVINNSNITKYALRSCLAAIGELV